MTTSSNVEDGLHAPLFTVHLIVYVPVIRFDSIDALLFAVKVGTFGPLCNDHVPVAGPVAGFPANVTELIGRHIDWSGPALDAGNTLL